MAFFFRWPYAAMMAMVVMKVAVVIGVVVNVGHALNNFARPTE